MSSPIENKMVAALLEHVPSQLRVLHGNAEVSGSEASLDVELHREVEIGSYRADIMLKIAGFDDAFRLVVECDGHDWHDRTKQQAAYDRSRDRELLQQGILTIRFTGSEIVHSPDRCATEAWKCFQVVLDSETRSTEAYQRGVKRGSNVKRPR